ncbi:MAG: ADP-ribosylglycohydrolase family protein [Muribaculaceae bacterium]|nr:ADP-ribosylglycohydrolase family protein [Muribaculaceae bacterium]
MLGSIIGDTIGSIYEFANIKTKSFDLCQPGMIYTDDSILTFATAQWVLQGGMAASYYLQFADNFPCPMGGYGPRFERWVDKSLAAMRVLPPFNSCGNGSAMRVSPVGWACDDESAVLDMARESAACTHNHLEGIKGAQATALAIMLARHGSNAAEIRTRIENDFGYDLSISVDEIRPRYSWDGLDGAMNGGTCQGSVPQAIICALEATDFEDAIRNAVSIGGDSDTIACITGGIAEPLFGIPQSLADWACSKLPDDLSALLTEFQSRYGSRIIPDSH